MCSVQFRPHQSLTLAIQCLSHHDTIVGLRGITSHPTGLAPKPCNCRLDGIFAVPALKIATTPTQEAAHSLWFACVRVPLGRGFNCGLRLLADQGHQRMTVSRLSKEAKEAHAAPGRVPMC